MLDDQMVHRRSQLIEAEVDGELVALHVDSGTCYGFNGTATRVWALIAEPKSLAELRGALLAEYDVEPELCDRQLRELLGELQRDGLIEIKPVALHG